MVDKIYIVIAVLLSASFSYWLLIDYKDVKGIYFILNLLILALIIGLIFMLFHYLFIDYLINDTLRRKWKEEYVYPYIEEIPFKESKIKDFELLINIDDKNNKFKVKIHYLNNEETLTTLQTKAKIKYVLKENEHPFMIYKEVEKDLGPDYDKGYYSVEIHLPKEYKLR